MVFEIPQYQSIDERMGRVRSQISIVSKQLEEHGHKITHIRGDIRLHAGRYELPLLRGYTGHLSIEDQTEFSAPNLTYIDGDLLTLGLQNDLDFERLESVTGNLSMELAGNPFPSLQRVVRLCLPVLKQIHGNLFLHDDAHFHAPNLHEVMGSIDAELPSDAPAFAGLVRIRGDLQLKGKADAFPNLEQIGSSLIFCDDYLDTGSVLLPKLIDVGGRLSANFPIDLLDQRMGPIAVAPRFHLLRTVYGNDLPGLVVHPAFDNPEGVDSQQQLEWFDAAFARWKMHYDALDGLAPSTADALHLETDDTPLTGIAL